MEQETSELLHVYTKLDGIAEEILADRQQIVDLEVKRNKSREALRVLRKAHPSNDDRNRTKQWVCFGNTFLKMETDKCMNMLATDQITIAEEVNHLRDGLKHKVDLLHTLEGQKIPKGFHLKGMNPEELSFM